MLMNVNVLVYLLVILFGISSWIDVNGLWVELPILVQELPEGWSLPSYMTIIIQLANIGPLIYTVIKLKCTHRLSEVPVIYFIIGVGAASCLLLGFLWDRTSYIGGNMHSTALLVLNFFLAFVDCTSSVVFLPFMAHFKKEYVTALFIGEGFSGLLPGLVALGQGAGETVCVNKTVNKNVTINGTVFNETTYAIFPEYGTPKFSVEAFFFFLFAMLVVSGIAFSLLNHSVFAQTEKVVVVEEYQESTEASFQADVASSSYELGKHSASSSRDNFLDAADNIHSQTRLLVERKRLSIQKDPSTESSQGQTCISSGTYILLLALTSWVCGLANGVLPSIQSFSALPYGNVEFHLTVTLGSIANPLSCFVAFFLPTSSTLAIIILSLVGTVFAGYCLLLAALSPDPILVGNLAGDILVVAAWFFVTFTLTYTKVSIATVLRSKGKRALLWYGAVTQVGSAVGALLMFILVNVCNVFHAASPCRQ